MYNPISATSTAGDVAAQLAALPMIIGAQVAVVTADGEVERAAVGLRHGGAGSDGSDLVSDATRFRPGSITKLLTATMVMQCADDGILDLDDPVTKHLPAFRLARSGDADRVLVRHLLAHSSGIDAADLFADTGDDDDAITRYVELLASSALLFAPGRWMSYCNAGFVVAGHLVAEVRGATWEEVARHHVLEPLEMHDTAFETGEEADRAIDVGSDVARGHLVDGAGTVVRVPRGTLRDDPMCTRGLAPAGATLTSTAGDLARLAAAHLGLRSVPPILEARTAGEMRRLHAAAPGGVTKQAGTGLAWQVWRGASPGDPLRPRIAGANPGQSGVIACDPRDRSALVVLTNTDQGVNAVNLLLDGMGPAAVPDDDAPPADLSPYIGRYRSQAMTLDVQAAEGDDGSGSHVGVHRLQLVVSDIDEARIGAMRVPGAAGDLRLDLDPVDRTTFRTAIGPMAFIDWTADHRPLLLRWRMRAHRRVDAPTP